MKRIALLLLTFAIAMAMACAPAPAPTPTPAAPKFPTKDITFIVPVSPGGGYDTNARILAPFLKKYLPGQPNVVVKNVPGGEWRLGIMEMYKSPPDGHTICTFNIPGNVIGQVTGQAEYDLNKVAWIGRTTDTIYVWAFSPKSNLRSLDDLRKAAQVKSGVVGLTSTSALAAIFAAREIGFKVKPINHDGSQEAILAAVRGDVDMVIFPYPSLRKFIVESKDLTPFAVFAKERLKDLPDTPTIVELGYEALLLVAGTEYMVGTVPGTPPEILKIWRDAFDKAVADPEFQKMMQDQLKLPAHPLNGEQTAERVKNAIAVFSKYKDLIMEYMPK